jgi:6-phosphogluconolactonase
VAPSVTVVPMSRGAVLRLAPSADALAAAAASEVLALLEAAMAWRGEAHLALAGGRTPAALYRVLASLRFDGWTHVHVWFGDERTVPPDHADSNYRMARETMLDSVPVPAENIHRVRAEEPAEAAAADYERELRDFFRELPRFDFNLMGLGPDAHTASLFPGTPVIHETARWVAAPWVEAQHTYRITFTPPVLNAAAHTVFLVSGGDKAAAVRAVLEGPRDVDRYPGQVVRPARGTLLWLLDREAASLLSDDTRS